MHRIAFLSVALLLVSACGRGPQAGPAPHQSGRYLGIGLYTPGPLWQRQAGIAEPRSEAAASLRDDEQVIVTVDAQTGEIRQCGNLSGHCIRMNPWAGQTAPVELTAHAEAVENGSDAAAPPAVNSTGR